MKMQIETVVAEIFGQNCSVIWREGSRDCLIVDPGLEPDLIHEVIETRELVPVAILNTHGHIDHIAGNPDMKRAYPDAPLIIGAGDEIMLSDPKLNLSGKYGFSFTSPPADKLVYEGDVLELAGFSFKVFEIPGHSPGHVVFYSESDGVVIGGDVLFRGSIGRTDFPGGSFEQLRDGIHKKLFTLPAETVVYPGHGPVTTIGHEYKTNPFVGMDAKVDW